MEQNANARSRTPGRTQLQWQLSTTAQSPAMVTPISDVEDGDMLTYTTRLLEARHQPPTGPIMEFQLFRATRVSQESDTGGK